MPGTDGAMEIGRSLPRTEKKGILCDLGVLCGAIGSKGVKHGVVEEETVRSSGS
jgi:hypothetical protein